MSNYSQNNFNQSKTAKELKSSKALMIVTVVVVGFMIVAFKCAIGN